MAQSALYILAGPKGSGKTTLALNDATLRDVPFINADIEAQRLSPRSPAKAALAAGRTTLSNIAHQISERNTFALETTLSGKCPLETMRRALAAEYTIDLTYVCSSSPELNITCVAMRVAAGGHHVPDNDILRRHSRSLLNLPIAASLAERVRAFDNTKGKKSRLIFEVRDRSVLLVHEELPDWFKMTFGLDRTIANPTRHIEERLQALGDLRR